MATSNLNPDVLERTLDQYTPAELTAMCDFLDTTFQLVVITNELRPVDDTANPGFRTVEVKCYRDEAPKDAKLVHMLLESLLAYRRARETVQPRLF